jgi:hypothetical protein
MPLVFKFLSLDVTVLHGQPGVETFEGLDAGHLIGARHMGTRRGEHWSDRRSCYPYVNADVLDKSARYSAATVLRPGER